jgi:tartrate dehydrogenase/decarboxylase/D-malate dehydrogenase
MSANSRIAVIPGDGIGLETTAEALRVLTHVSEAYGCDLEFESFEWGCDHYVRSGRMMDPDGLEALEAFDAIFLGAVGRPDVPDRVSVWELILPIRRHFEQYINLRPVRLFEGVPCPLRDRGPADIDFVVVRENNEGEYVDVGGSLYAGTADEICSQMAIFTRAGTERAVRFACELAEQRGGGLISATKSNGLPHSMPFWDRVVEEVAAEYPDVALQSMHIDALAGLFVLHPERLDVVVASNLFGDILSDLGAAISGSIGMGPSANLNPERRHPSMFEPIHGSAPDIAGEGVANPIGQIWSAAMMLTHLGHLEAGDAVVDAIAAVLRAGRVRTPDLGGAAGTAELTDAIIGALQSPTATAGASS